MKEVDIKIIACWGVISGAILTMRNEELSAAQRTLNDMLEERLGWKSFYEDEGDQNESCS